ncbi:MAG: hypothetical protein U9R27_09150 [Campylobacterota bacterium]|nr:hypothetical protein [Campylobacterota bacterium]
MRSFRNFIRIRKRVTQRATIYSLLVVILLFGLFLEAYMHNFNLVYITLFFVFATAFSAGPFGILNIGQLEAGFSHTQRLYAGEDGNCLFRVSNLSTAPAWAITVHCDSYATQAMRIEAESSSLIALSISPQKRGRMHSDECWLQSFFPLSTVRFVLPVEKCCEAIIYPRPSGKPLSSFLSQQERPFGEERDFDGLSPYSGKESLSRIHWASVAKGEPAVKQFAHVMETKELVFDFYRSGRDDESRLSQLTLWVLECERTREAFRINMPHKVLKSNQESVDAILEYLALY